jgi:hypothetical protein
MNFRSIESLNWHWGKHMKLHIWATGHAELEVRSPTISRLVIALACGPAGYPHGPTPTHLNSTEMSRLDADAPTNLARFRIFCLQRTPYGGKTATHLSEIELTQARRFIRESAHLGKGVTVSNDE